MYAIEEFILKRKQLGIWKQDKYFLALTATSVEDNFDSGAAEAESQKEEGKVKTEQKKNATKILSSWEHSFKHLH